MKMIPLKQISVPTHCDEAWDGMAGNAQARLCERCSHHVHDLSEMSRTEAQALLDRSQGRLCVRFVPDANGAPLTREDLAAPARRASWPRRWAAAVSWAAAVLVSGMGLAQAAGATKQGHGKTTKSGHARTKHKPHTGHLPRPVPYTRPSGATMGIVAPPSAVPPPVAHPPHRMGKVAPPPTK